MYFTGQVVPPRTVISADDWNHSFRISEADVLSIVQQLPGKPVLFEHKDKLPAGVIESASRRADGSVWVIGNLNEDNLAGNYVRASLKDGLYTGLSLGHLYRAYADGSSSNTICGSPISAQAPQSLRFMPPDRRPAGLSAWFNNSTLARVAATASSTSLSSILSLANNLK